VQGKLQQWQLQRR